LALALALNAALADQTSVTQDLNNMIADSTDKSKIYIGGKGVFIRNVFDSQQDDPDRLVVPGTFWVNDIYAPSQIYPDIDAGESCSDVAHRATVAVVVGTMMPELFYDYDNIQSDDWGWGVFYATDSNCADVRCRRLGSYSGYDCPGGWLDDAGTFAKDDVLKGSGSYPAGNPFANPAWGGGTGCHFDQVSALNQEYAADAYGTTLVLDYDCQCNYDDFRDNWGLWVDHWLQNGRRDWPWPTGWASVDQTACWMNNPRDMIALQNWMYWDYGWYFGLNDPAVRYWGWNEIPVDRLKVGDPANWDAILIHLPADICNTGDGTTDSPACLASDDAVRLEANLQKNVDKQYLLPGFDFIGRRPGSYVVFVREWYEDDGTWHGAWRRWFFCEWWESPNKKFVVIFNEIDMANNDYGACYVDWGSMHSTRRR